MSGDRRSEPDARMLRRMVRELAEEPLPELPWERIEERLFAELEEGGSRAPIAATALQQSALEDEPLATSLFVDDEDLRAVFRKIVLGLREFGRVHLPWDVPVGAALLPPPTAAEEAKRFDVAARGRRFGDHTEVMLAWIYYEDDQETTEWLFRMFESRIVWVGTGDAAGRYVERSEGVIVGGEGLRF